MYEHWIAIDKKTGKLFHGKQGYIMAKQVSIKPYHTLLVVMLDMPK
jgi:hypothetical protein